MGGCTNIQQLVKLMTKLSLLVREKEAIFLRKYDCINALSELKYEAEQGRHDMWHTTPKIVEVLAGIVGTTAETKVIQGEVQSIAELNDAWYLSKEDISKKQLPLLAFILKYIQLVPVTIDKHSSRLGDAEYDRGVKIRQASAIVQNIEKHLSRTEEVLYLYYLIQVFDTDEGRNALSLLVKRMRQRHPQEIKAELDALQSELNIPRVIHANKNYVEIINRIYDAAERSRGLHDKTVTEMLELKHWIIFKLHPLLERNQDILAEQSITIQDMKRIWISTYSERDMMDNIKKLVSLVEEEKESRERIKEELDYYMRTKQVLKDIVRFTKSAEHQLMSHHASLFTVAIFSYNIFPLLSAFYSADEFNQYWDAAEDFVMPKSSIRKIFSSAALRGFTSVF
ncbi:hypothetical protein ACFL96_11015 [Thermoproteota archaeon]